MRTMNMDRYTKAELAVIHFIYGIANGNGRAAVLLFGGRYLTRRQPSHQTFSRVQQNLDPSEPQLKVLGGHEQHGLPYLKREDFRELLTDVPHQFGAACELKKHEAPYRNVRCVRDHLHRTFPNRGIRPGGLVTWPPKSLDLYLLDFFFSGMP
ncbi:hypothetical protein TNCV_2088021 [Trichonephila clavipes]|nr:hypothetical protein TNCV_2088021 [Trichonephila clavipes]